MNREPLLLIAVESPFSERDRQRFDIERLTQRFKVQIIDLSPVAQPVLHELRSDTSIDESHLLVIRSLEQLESLFETINGGALISNLGVGKIRHELFRLARIHKLLIAEFELGAMPDIADHQRSFCSRAVQRIRQLPSIWQLPKTILNRMRLQDSYGDLPDVFYRGGRLARGRHPQLGSVIVDVHSFDYELARTIDRSSLGSDPSRIVYLDQNLGFHSDVPGLGLKQPVSAHNFYPLINEYFDWLETEHGLHVVICPHPRARVSATRYRFPGKEISESPTAVEVARSGIVCGHVSTSFSFAVIFRKPALILTSAELSHSWYAPYIKSFGEKLAAPLVNLSVQTSWKAPSPYINAHQEALYDQYEINYLNSSVSPTRRLWDQISDDIFERTQR